MGFFSMNEHSNLSSNFEFPVVEGYRGTIGCGLAIVEGYQNDLALFTAAVQSDITEMASIKEGADITSLQEASISGMWEAIKQFFIKLGAKIKSLFTAFMAKIEGHFTKDLKGYVKKYEKNLNGKDFKDMKAKYAAPKNDKSYVKANAYPNYNIGVSYVKDWKEDDTERADIIETIYRKVPDASGVSSAKEYDDWYHEQVFEDEEEKDDWDYPAIRAIADRLVENTKCVSDIKKESENQQKHIREIIKEIEKEEKRVNDLYKGNKTGKADDKRSYVLQYDANAEKDKRTVSQTTAKDSAGNDIANMQRAVSMARMQASCYQEVVLHISQVIMKEVKFGLAQDKRIFAKAIAYKTVKEETLLNAIEDCAFDEAMEFLDNESSAA